MRGRLPSVLSLDPADVERLHTTAHSDSLPWYQVRRARIVLARAGGQRKQVRGGAVDAEGMKDEGLDEDEPDGGSGSDRCQQ